MLNISTVNRLILKYKKKTLLKTFAKTQVKNFHPHYAVVALP